MLHLHHGNRLEILAQACMVSMQHSEIPPLAPHTVLVESPSLGRWLKNQICLQNGINCLTRTELPATWLWQQARLSLGLAEHEDPLSREPLQWRIFAALDSASPFRAQSGLDEISNYLADADELKRWQLAGRIADAFDRYQYYRPDTIRDWSAGRENDWQAQLWRTITENIDIHRVALMDRFLQQLHGGEAINLPPRIDLFAIHNMPPLLLQAFNAIAQHTRLHLWLLSPTPEYWADLATPREMARKRRQDPEALELWQAGNPLLTQWGRQGQIFQDLLLDDTIQMQDDSEHFVRPESPSLLGRIQGDIFDALAPDTKQEQPGSAENIENETAHPSIQFHICHGPLRECQVLHDTLLHCLQADNSLQPEDILVLVPEISRYAPYIEAVFGSIADNTRIPYNISDVIQADEHPLIQAFLDLLKLPESRFSRAEVLGLANIPQVRQRFALQEGDMADLTELFDQLRIFWGLDGSDKQRLNLPDIDENTWHQGFTRIMAGFALGKTALLTSEPPIAPISRVDAASAETAARFLDLLDTLKRWSARLSQAGTPAEWADRLSSLLDDMFSDIDDDNRLERIREAIRDLSQAEWAGVTTLPPEVIRYWLNQVLGTQTDKSRFYTGGVTFCAMKPLRGVPFRVIALLGMQDNAYPRRRKHNEFDRMNHDWQHGDPDAVHEDRYLFLEALLAARDTFIINYTGRDARSNTELQASVLVQELRDYLDAHYRVDNHKPSSALSRVHPLHPFSAGNFSHQAAARTNSNEDSLLPHVPGFDKRWLQTATAIHQHQPPQAKEGWPAYSLQQAEHFEYKVTPQELATFFKAPIKYFIQKRLRLYEAKDLELVENEPFELDKLEKWKVRNLLLQSWLQGEDKNTTDRLPHAHGILPHGSNGEVILAEVKDEFNAIKTLCGENNISPPLSAEPVDIDLELAVEKNRWQVSGRIDGIYADHGLLEISASKFSLIKLLPLWIRHLCLHASGHTIEGKSQFIGLDQSCTLRPLAQDEAREQLKQLLSLYEAGLQMPLAFPERTALACFEALNKGKDNDQALKSARGKWQDNRNYTGEVSNYFNQLVLHAHQWQPDNALIDMVDAILKPVQEYLEENND